MLVSVQGAYPEYATQPHTKLIHLHIISSPSALWKLHPVCPEIYKLQHGIQTLHRTVTRSFGPSYLSDLETPAHILFPYFRSFDSIVLLLNQDAELIDSTIAL